MHFSLNFSALRKLKETKNELSSTAEKLSSTQLRLIKMQFDNAGKHVKARKYTKEQKTICSAILKISRKCYDVLRSLFLMPSVRTLRRHLKKVKLHTGINNNVFKEIKQTVLCMDDDQEKGMSLLWDEFSVQPYVHYDQKQDKIIDFEDFGDKRTSNFADYVLVFMVRGMKSGTKMPISYYHAHSSTIWEQLMKCIKENIKAVAQTGLQIVLTICDQGASNCKALRELRKQYEIKCARKSVDPGQN